jgi:type I restriction enzyme S subunit
MLEVVLPADRNLLNSFHRTCENLFLKAECNRRESKQASAIRDTLLPKLLSGEIRVKEAESLAEAAP